MKESQWCSVNYGFGLEVEAYEQEKELARLQQLERAVQWCVQNHAKIEHTGSNVIIEAPGFDKIIAETLQEAVELAVELEQKCTPPVQEELPDWIPSAAELDELEESLQAGAQMARDESGVIQAQEINGAYYL